MRFLVFNGSPKNQKQSTTMQYIMFMRKMFPDTTFEIINVGSQISRLENDTQYFHEIYQSISAYDGIIWAFPVYYLLVPSQLKRFIELLFHHNSQKVFENKPVAAFCTSIHFCDTYAINYIKEISEDLVMKFFDTYSAEMFDLQKEKERDRLTQFTDHFIRFCQLKTYSSRKSLPIIQNNLKIEISNDHNLQIKTTPKILILTDETASDLNLMAMTGYFKNMFSSQIELFNIRDFGMKGGCLGCIMCGYDFTCVYNKTDSFQMLYTEKVKWADIIIYAGSIKDRYLSSLWKQLFDRSFFHNHTPMLSGKQVAMIISGPFRQISNLNLLFQNYFEVQNVNLAGIVSDDTDSADAVKNDLINLAYQIVKMSEEKYCAPKTFIGIAARKIFRDDIYCKLRFPFVNDYKHYKRLGYFDFPQKDIKNKIINSVLSFLTNFPKIRKSIYQKGYDIGVIQPFQKKIQSIEVKK